MQNIDLTTMQENAAAAEQLLSLLANQNRLMILCNLVEEEQSVSQLLQVSPLSQSALSQHLAKLRDADVVKTRRDGQTIHYRLASNEVRVIIETLCGLYGEENQSE